MSNYFLTLMLACTCSLFAAAQRQEPNILVDVNGQPWKINNPEARVRGNPWLSDDWAPGYVLLLNGKKADSIMMNFDLQYQRPMYTNAGVVYAFNDSVKEFKFVYTENGAKKTAFFRSGYPAKGRHKESTLYQVLAEGPKYELLQYSDRLPKERRDFNGPMTIFYEPYAELYLYDTDSNTMHKIKAKKSSVTDALPDQKAAIEKICTEKGLDLRSAEEIALLVKNLQ